MRLIALILFISLLLSTLLPPHCTEKQVNVPLMHRYFNECLNEKLKYINPKSADDEIINCQNWAKEKATIKDGSNT